MSMPRSLIHTMLAIITALAVASVPRQVLGLKGRKKNCYQ
jgi:hypothetical protein